MRAAALQKATVGVEQEREREEFAVFESKRVHILNKTTFERASLPETRIN